MAFRLSAFDGLTLPNTYRDDDGITSTAEIPVDYITLPGQRTWNARRTDRGRPSRMRYEMRCAIVGTSAADLLSQESALKAKSGITGTLTRVDYAATAHTVLASLSIPQTEEKVGFGQTWRPITLVFDMAEWPWTGAARNGSVTITGAEGAQALHNHGDAPYPRPVFTLTAGSGSVTAFTFWGIKGTRVWKWAWAGTLAATKALVIDCGAGTVKNDGADAYAGLTRDAAHNQDSLCEVPNGPADEDEVVFTLAVTHSGTDPTFAWVSADGHQA